MALKDVIGQERVVNILLRTIQRGRIPSSYLFIGESGIGKKFTALNLAKALNCLKTVTSYKLQVTSEGRIQNSEHQTPNSELNSSLVTRHSSLAFDCCDECSSCKKIDSGMHPDFLLISPEGGQIKIEEIRAIDDMLSFKPFEGRWKIVIVDEANTMNPYAANAFLKTLEEPPRDSLIILVSSNPDRLPDTIRSRCSRVNFTPLSYEACKKVIERAISHQSAPPPFPPSQGSESTRTEGREGVKAPNRRTPELPNSRIISTLVRLSMGRPGLAISADLIEERAWFLDLLQEMLKTEKDGWTSREEMEKWFDLILLLFRDAAVTKITQDEKNLINSDLKDYIKKFSSSMDLKVIIENYQKLNTLRGYLNFNLNRSLTWNYTGSLLRRMNYAQQAARYQKYPLP